MDGVIVGGWGWVVAAYGSAGLALALYAFSLFARRRRAEDALIEANEGEASLELSRHGRRTDGGAGQGTER